MFLPPTQKHKKTESFKTFFSSETLFCDFFRNNEALKNRRIRDPGQDRKKVGSVKKNRYRLSPIRPGSCQFLTSVIDIGGGEVVRATAL